MNSFGTPWIALAKLLAVVKAELMVVIMSSYSHGSR